MADVPPTIEVRRDGDGFAVVVSPPDPVHPPRHFDQLRDAYGFAGGTRMTTGWPRVDLTGELDRGKT